MSDYTSVVPILIIFSTTVLNVFFFATVDDCGDYVSVMALFASRRIVNLAIVIIQKYIWDGCDASNDANLTMTNSNWIRLFKYLINCMSNKLHRSSLTLNRIRKFRMFSSGRRIVCKMILFHCRPIDTIALCSFSIDRFWTAAPAEIGKHRATWYDMNGYFLLSEYLYTCCY